MPGCRILVVDDDPDIIDYLSSFLGDEGYEVGSATSSVEALDQIEEIRPDGVLIDVMMPGKSGLDLLVTLRRDPRWTGIPLVMVTGNDRILQDECHSYLGSYQGVRGPDGVLAKPIDRNALLAILKQLCSKH